jgi:hypothetical protein
MATLDSAVNFAKVTVSIGYNSAATSIALNTGQGVLLPAAPFNVVWWNSTDYPDPSSDPNVEIVRVTNIATDTLTVTRAQEGTAASNKNTGGKTYLMIAALTAKVINNDLPSVFGSKFTGSATFAFTTPIQDGSTAQGPTTIAIAGVVVGDPVFIGANPVFPAGITVWGKVTAAGVVTVEVQNLSGGPYTPGSTTYTAMVIH